MHLRLLKGSLCSEGHSLCKSYDTCGAPLTAPSEQAVHVVHTPGPLQYHLDNFMGSSSSKTKRKPAAPQSAPPAQSSSFITSLTAICVALAVTSFLLLQSGYLRPPPHGLRVSGNMSINPAARRTVGYFVSLHSRARVMAHRLQPGQLVICAASTVEG